MAVGIREASLIGVAGAVAWFGTNLLPPHPGIEQVVKAVGTLACIGGGAIGLAGAALQGWRLVASVTICVAIGALGVVGFFQVATGTPGQNAALMLYALSAVIFLPLGILIQMAGLTLGGGDSDDG